MPLGHAHQGTCDMEVWSDHNQSQLLYLKTINASGSAVEEFSGNAHSEA